jgi:lysophospholipase L1-like esterase
MNTVWTFGDSLTERYNPNFDWSKKYIEWKGYRPKVHGDFLSEMLNYELKNLGMGGSDNYTIFETFCKNINEIKVGDIVIIGWSDVGRFRLSNKNGHWLSIIPNHSNVSSYAKHITESTVNEILVNRTADIYVDEVNNWINLIKKSLNGVKLVNWSTFNFGKINGIFIHNTIIETISKETNNEVEDQHFSEKGQMKLAEIIVNIINDMNNNLNQKLL